jgi:hypothetical protein
MEDNLPEVINVNHPVLDAFVQISQSRTNYQLQKFVVGQHDTEEQRYKQVVLEIQNMAIGIQKSLLDLQKLNIKKKQLEKSRNKIDKIDSQIIALDIQGAETGLIGAKKELDYLMSIWDSFEHKYTAEEIESAQEEYWNKRLNRQAALESIGSGGVVSWAALDALNQIGGLPSLDPNYYREIAAEQAREIK